ncbi:DUF3073 domain-containing protein [Galactobacter sp.]|uniref:DUF3073 domain-containing protein n=1 Tax=Galactobacter sp. TaxID=2676125 RepID=UPI0025BF6399|nr:DUF3073 domain-containing protein [Galactobacter sp.]
MGRGRQKAKATRQAREMKYYSPGTDLHALERELAGGNRYSGAPEWEEPEEDEDPYARYAGEYDDDEDEAQRG